MTAHALFLQVLGSQHRYEKGLDKLEFTAKQVSVMRRELQALKPNLERKVCTCVLSFVSR